MARRGAGQGVWGLSPVRRPSLCHLQVRALFAFTPPEVRRRGSAAPARRPRQRAPPSRRWSRTAGARSSAWSAICLPRRTRRAGATSTPAARRPAPSAPWPIQKRRVWALPAGCIASAPPRVEDRNQRSKSETPPRRCQNTVGAPPRRDRAKRSEPGKEQPPRRRSHRHRSDLQSWNCWTEPRMTQVPELPCYHRLLPGRLDGGSRDPPCNPPGHGLNRAFVFQDWPS